MPLTVCITGATGYLGRELSTALLARGHAVRALVRPGGAARAAAGTEVRELDVFDADALTAMRRSLEQHGQLCALTLFVEPGGLEIVDGFKRVRAARALGWSTLLAHVDEVGAVEAKLRDRLGVRIAVEAVRPGQLDAWTEVGTAAKLKRFRDER